MLNLKEMTREQLEYDICGMETVYQMNERKFKSWSLQQTLKAKNPDEAKMLQTLMQHYDKIRDMDGDTYCDFVDKIRMEWEKANEEKEAHLKSCDFEMLKESLDMAVVALERQVPAKTIIKDFFKLPVPIGGTVYEREFPKYSNMVIGYRIGRMMGEEPENYEEDYEPDVWYLQL